MTSVGSNNNVPLGMVAGTPTASMPIQRTQVTKKQSLVRMMKFSSSEIVSHLLR